MKQSATPLVTTLIGGVAFLLPLVVVLYVLGQGLALTARVAQPLTSMLPDKSIGGIAFASIAALVLLLLLCFSAGLLARAAFGRALTDQFEARLQTVYPRYAVIKAMSQGLHGVLGHRVLKPVLVTFDDHQLIAFDIKRLDDGPAPSRGACPRRKSEATNSARIQRHGAPAPAPRRPDGNLRALISRPPGG